MQELIRYIGSVFSFDPNSPLLFTQFQFWAFFALVFAGFALAKCRRLLRNSYLFFVSLLFYYKTSGLFVGLLILVTCTDFFIAQAIHDSKVQWKRRALLVLSVTIDLGILCYFKYAYFFADIVHSIFGFQMTVSNVAASAGNAILGTNFFDVDRIILPVGISFYTFQVISYTCDVYKGLIKPVRNILDFGFYVTFFPQLVAGPIVKASDFIPQLYKKYNLSHRMFGIAVFWILNGLVKKIVLSDYLAVNFIDRVFDNPHLFSGFENLMSLFVYSLQVYADFSGYTDIAIGLSLLMGFHLPMNFNSPYKALNCSNFWKRWHISLSRWLQTYLYIPLGGNRNITFGTYFWIIVITLAALVLSGSWWVASGVLIVAAMVIYTAYKHPERRKKIYANLNAMITMLLGGLWHGASMNFVIWGGLNGVGMIVYKFWRDNSALWRVGLSLIVVAVLAVLIWLAPAALWNVLIVCAIFIAVSAIIRWLYEKYNTKERNLKWLANSWAILVTFTFISFTRLFFRSGSNLDPATANEVAWKTAKSMVQQMGTSWNVNVFDVLWGYHNVFLLFVIGMIIHWLPVKVKRRYRLTFASLPLPAIGAIVVVVVFFVYQFVTAEMQPFIYFQF
jgi:D-alanyl-lipoteichoic acid acyltransferase DltB (MBOAT superfamily)